uniref:Uncharacterized protein n=1 Tax=Anopheles epiroticus TaxID=199890 RepID=A0A182PR44_9DIPT
MEEADRGAAHVGEVEKTVGKRKDEPSSSLSSEDFDNWTLLGKDNDRLQEESSGVQEISREDVTKDKAKCLPPRKQRQDSHRSSDLQLDESSDGISIISESETSCIDEDSHDDQGGTVHFSRKIDLKDAHYEPLTPPYTPDEVESVKEASNDKKRQLQVKHTDENLVEPVRSIVEHSAHAPVSTANWIIFSFTATAMVAVILGNSMRLQNRVDEINFEHEKRISELELENNILKNEMNKLRHLYTRSELDEQVQRAEFEWNDAMKLKTVEEAINEPGKSILETKTEEVGERVEKSIRKVPPQDSGVKRKVVWSGDEEEPMLIVDKDYVLPAFCYNQDQAVHDDLFSEYSAKYCDVKKRKIEAKQKKAEYNQKMQQKEENYNKFINSATIDPSQEKRIDPEKLASPFNIDYQKAFDAIKAEGSVIVEALGSILDLSPEPEENVATKDRMDPAVITTPSAPEAPDVSEDPLSFGPKDTEMIKKEIPEHDRRKEAKSQKYDDNNQRQQWPEEKNMHIKGDRYRSMEQNEYKKRKDGSDRSGQNGQHKHKHGHVYGSNEQEGHVKDKSHENSFKQKYNDDSKRRNRHIQNHHHYSESHKSVDDDDDHYKKKFNHHEAHKDRHHNGHSFDAKGARQREGSSSFEEQAGEESYLLQHKRSEWKKDKKHHDDDYHRDKHAYRQHPHQKNGDWNEKRYKGRDDYRQNGGKQGDQHWQERMKHGRQEARDEQRKHMDQENNWYLERGNQREEDRIFHHIESGQQ